MDIQTRRWAEATPTHKDFQADIRPGWETYRVRLKVPYGYTDGLLRVTVFKHDTWPGWKFSVNAYTCPDHFKSRKAASRAAMRAVRQMIAAMRTLKLKDLIPE
jgi:hypothetical protein